MNLEQLEPFTSRYADGEGGGLAGLQQRYRAACEHQHLAAVRNAALVQDVRRLQHTLSSSSSSLQLGSSQLSTLKLQYEQHVAAVYPGWLAEVDVHRKSSPSEVLPLSASEQSVFVEPSLTASLSSTVPSTTTTQPPVMATLPLSSTPASSSQHYSPPVNTAAKISVTSPPVLMTQQPDPLTSPLPTLSTSPPPPPPPQKLTAATPTTTTKDAAGRTRQPSRIPVLQARVKPPGSERIPPSSSIKKTGTALPGVHSTPLQALLSKPKPTTVTLAVVGRGGEDVPDDTPPTTASAECLNSSPHNNTSSSSSSSNSESAKVVPASVNSPPSDSFTRSSPISTSPIIADPPTETDITPPQAVADNTLSPAGLKKTPRSEEEEVPDFGCSPSPRPSSSDSGAGGPASMEAVFSPPVAESSPIRPPTPMPPVRPDSTDPLNLLDDLSMSSSIASMETPCPLIAATAVVTINVETEAVKPEKPSLDEISVPRVAEPTGELDQSGESEQLQTVSSHDETNSATTDESDSSAAVVPLHESAAYRSLTQPLPSLGQEEAEEGGEASLLLLSEESAIADLEREIQSSGLPPSPADEGATDQTPDVTDDVSCDTSPSPSAPVAAPVEQRSQVSNTSALKRRLGFLGDSDSECDLPPTQTDEEQDFDFYS